MRKELKDIYSIPCARYCSGKKAIRIVETPSSRKAYVQFADGMQTWKFNANRNVWEMISQVVCNNC